ncbi:MAG TPA: TIGR02391 family protein [Pseudonocardiaceae bacterium]|jgi:uncharacterized protein (TIGR02391 family)|nr:TIGR02391 family protein [Pseudonocardiaceae bacterium]
MRGWDNIEILRAVDQHQELTHGAPAWSVDGLQLMNGIAGSPVTEDGRWRGFVQELQIAKQAGLLTFTVEQHAPDPGSSPHYYLQTIRNFALTVAGQDRARGQVVRYPGPDLHEDDGRLISDLLLQRIGEAISEEYTPAHVALFLREAGLPPNGLVMPEGLAGDAAAILRWLAGCGSEGRRALRSFLGRWLDDRLISGPNDELRRTLIDRFARGGWFLQDGTLVVGEPAAGKRVNAPVLRDARLAALHPLIKDVAEGLYRNEHRSEAVFAAMKAVNNRVKDLSGLDSDGASLMGTAFSAGKPRLRTADLSTETGRNIQDGVRFLLMGAMQALRNPGAHEPFPSMSDEEAFDQLGLASLLMRRLDQTTRVAP